MMLHRHFEETETKARAEAEKKAEEVKEGEDIVKPKTEAKKPARTRK